MNILREYYNKEKYASISYRGAVYTVNFFINNKFVDVTTTLTKEEAESLAQQFVDSSNPQYLVE
jgi:hypothetical protein